MLLLDKQAGGVERISEPKVQELLDLKEDFGMGVDPRRMENADLCVNTDFGRGFNSVAAAGCATPAKPPQPMTPPETLRPAPPGNEEVERMVQEITDRIMTAIE